MTTKKNQSYIISTLKFCIAGLFIPMLTIYAIVGLQMGIGLLGIECKTAWTILWTITTIGAIMAPWIFIRLMNKRLSTGFNFSTDKLLNFNIAEFAFIQCSIATFFTNGQTLCYGNGGQNGLEFMFTGWLALPFLIIFSLIFDNLRNRKIEEVRADRLTTNED
ncbi:MAG: hypothetical protein RLO12_02945 [Fulvivirga sp.]